VTEAEVVNEVPSGEVASGAGIVAGREAEPVLATHELCRRFGGLMAVRNVSIELRRGVVHALLGPNGAGKSTLINLLSGDLPATSGTVLYEGRDITRFSPDRRSRIGIGRSYQKTNVFPQFTAYENCRLAAQSRKPRALHLLERATSLPDAREAAERSLEAAGLAGRAGLVASTLSHGEQRQLEIAMVLATAPKVLLLDEPLAGMGAEEAQRMVELLQRLAPHHAMLLVEHDMDAVFALADVITVMVNGEVLESGRPEAIRASPAVRQAYLPDDAVVEETAVKP
jgi:branched-chain amino acid transport system ATP-binding protein